MSAGVCWLALALVAGDAAGASLLGDIAARERRTDAVVGAVAAGALTGQAPAASAETRPAAELRGLAPWLALLPALRPATPDRLARVDALLDNCHGAGADRLREHLSATDRSHVATRLVRDERHDRWAAGVNDTLRPFGLGTNLLALANPILLAGSALDSAFTAVAHVRNRNRPSMREHEALAAYGDATRVSPDGRLDPVDARRARHLDRRVRKAECRRLAGAARAAYDDRRLDDAAYLLRSPAAAPCSDTLRAVGGDVQGALADRAVAHEAARWPAAEPRLPRSAGEWRAYRAVAAAAVGGDVAATLLASGRLEAGWPDGPNAPAARLLAAGASHRAGRIDTARRGLEQVADGDGTAADVARAQLASFADADAAAVAAAERRHARDVTEHVLLGTGPSTRGVVRAAMHTGAQGAAGLPTLGITNAIGILTRAVMAWRRDPASNDEVIAEGETYLARHPRGADAEKVRRRLVRAYERSERWDRALLHYQALPDPDQDRVRDYEDEIADDMLARAAANPRDAALLRAVVTQYPASTAADRAREILDARDTGGGVRVPRDVLDEVPWLLGATGLGLPAGLLDGDDGNGELDDAGIRITPWAIECTVRTPDGAGMETVALSADQRERAFATLAEIGRLHRAAHPEEEEEEGPGRWERWIPFFVEGAVGDAGVAVRPGIKLRPYEPAYPERYR